MLRRSFLASAIIVLAVPALAQDAAPQDLFAPDQPAQPRALTDAEKALINDISAHNTEVRTMAGRFIQIDTQGQRIEGTFFLQRPGKILFRYNPPSYEQIVSVGRGFYVVDRKEQTQYAYPQDKVPLRQFLDDKIDLLAANIVAISQSADYFSLTLQDDTPAGIVRVTLVFDTESKDLKQWTLTEPSGAELTFSLYDVKTGVEIPKAMFYIDPTFRAVSAPKEG